MISQTTLHSIQNAVPKGKRLTREGLINLLPDMAKNFPQVAGEPEFPVVVSMLAMGPQHSKGKITCEIVAKAMRVLVAQPGLKNYWNEEGVIPDCVIAYGLGWQRELSNTGNAWEGLWVAAFEEIKSIMRPLFLEALRHLDRVLFPNIADSHGFHTRFAHDESHLQTISHDFIRDPGEKIPLPSSDESTDTPSLCRQTNLHGWMPVIEGREAGSFSKGVKLPTWCKQAIDGGGLPKTLEFSPASPDDHSKALPPIRAGFYERSLSYRLLRQERAIAMFKVAFLQTPDGGWRRLKMDDLSQIFRMTFEERLKLRFTSKKLILPPELAQDLPKRIYSFRKLGKIQPEPPGEGDRPRSMAEEEANQQAPGHESPKNCFVLLSGKEEVKRAAEILNPEGWEASQGGTELFLADLNWRVDSVKQQPLQQI